jgi:AraC family transcriptional regulator, transcriptional activator of pobA
MRVQEVGFALGYDDPAYFARAFRRLSGLSPSDYRARLEG